MKKDRKRIFAFDRAAIEVTSDSQIHVIDVHRRFDAQFGIVPRKPVAGAFSGVTKTISIRGGS